MNLLYSILEILQEEGEALYIGELMQLLPDNYTVNQAEAFLETGIICGSVKEVSRTDHKEKYQLTGEYYAKCKGKSYN